MIYFTKHAEEKLNILRYHKFEIIKEQVIEVINNPDFIDHSRVPLLIAQERINASYVLRVVYKQKNSVKIIITFYPGRIKRYEQ